MLQLLKIAVNFTRDCGMVSINLPVFKIESTQVTVLKKSICIICLETDNFMIVLLKQSLLLDNSFELGFLSIVIPKIKPTTASVNKQTRSSKSFKFIDRLHKIVFVLCQHIIDKICTKKEIFVLICISF